MVPVGQVWQSFLAGHDRPLLHDRDRSHPTLAGSYLAACVFLAVLLKQSPVGLDIELKGLDRDDRTLLQNAGGNNSFRS